MPSMLLVVIAVLIAFISALAAILAAAQRQFDTAKPGERSGRRGSGSVGVIGTDPGRLAPIISRSIEDATRFLPRNSSEARAVSELRLALRLAVDGDFGAEVRVRLDAVPGVKTLHDVRKAVVGGPSIDHLIVAPSGVIVIDSVVRSSKVTVQPDAVYVGRGRGRARDPMVDNVLRKMAAVVGHLGTIPVHGVIVFQDLLTLPPEIRAGTAVVRGVQLLTVSRLETCIARPGPLADVSVVAAELRAAFESALPPAGQELRLSGSGR